MTQSNAVAAIMLVLLLAGCALKPVTPEVKIEEVKEEFRPGRLTVPSLSITLYELKSD